MEDVISFLRKNGIAVLVEVHRRDGTVRTEKLEELAEPHLFRQLDEKVRIFYGARWSNSCL